MKKTYPFNVLGSKRCVDCDRQLKKRFENEKEPRRCYPCHISAEGKRGHRMKQ